MAGSIVTTQSIVPRTLSGTLVGSIAQGLRSPVLTQIVWTSDASGNVSANTVEMPSGSFVMVQFVPGTAGVQPTDLYDVTFTDAAGTNAFDDGTGTSIGANLSNVNASKKVPFIFGASSTFVRAWMPSGLYTPVVANAGNAKSGTIRIYQTIDVL